MLSSAVIKVSLKEPPKKVVDTARFIQLFGVSQAHIVHVRTYSNTKKWEKDRQKLADLEEHIASLGMHVETHIFDGHVPAKVIEASRQLNVDCIGIAWVQKPVLRNALLGSIDVDILRMSDIPVCIYDRPLISKAPKLEKVLYATDFQATDANVMPYLQNKDFQAHTLYLLHVGERAPDPVTEKARREKARHNLERLSNECRRAYDNVEFYDTVGSVRRTIVSWANAKGVDLIVIGKADNPDVIEQLTGSVAEFLPHKTKCSVFIIPGFTRKNGNEHEQAEG